MYKLENGKLVSPPKVWKGIVGYDRDLLRLKNDGYKPLIETGVGELFRYIDKKDCIEKNFYKKPYNYREEREKVFPKIGDVIDALLKAYQGDTAELDIIITQRQIVKNSIKKQ